jgi:hypothetical protein
MNKLLLGVVAVFAMLTNARLVGVFVPIMAATGLIAADTANYFQAPGTKTMAERLEKIAREINPGNSVFFSAERVEVFGSQVGAIQDSERLKQVLPGFALDLLNAGRTEEAIDVLAKVERLTQTERRGLRPSEQAAPAHLPGGGPTPSRRAAELFDQSHDRLVLVADTREWSAS